VTAGDVTRRRFDGNVAAVVVLGEEKKDEGCGRCGNRRVVSKETVGALPV